MSKPSKSTGNLFVVSGPSGSGKSTLCRLMPERDTNIKLSISATTRAPREGEEEGVAYFFLTKEEFFKRIAREEFYEHAGVYDNFYGTLRSFVDEELDRGKDVILEIDPQGAFQVKRKKKDATLVFIMPPSLEILKERLKGRGTESETEVEKRFAKCQEEIAFKDRYDVTIVNDDLERAAAELLALICSKRKG